MDAPDNAHEFTVSELSSALKRSIEDQFGNVRLRGEISGWKVPASGHAYFALKDDAALIDAVMWKGGRARLNFRPEDGMEVVATGRLTTYPGRSKYQIVVESLELAGEGALLAMIERRKAMLAAEGLFAPERKRPIPWLPELIGVVTSPTGAVIRDILHRLGDRFPRDVLVWPVKVQGDGAADEVAAAIRGFNAMPRRPDVIIVARGGGSIEDLMAFNEEIVVRAAAVSEIPLISAVGHETDTTLIDFASDRRAPTPTAAAELAVPVRAELVAGVSSFAARLDRCIASATETRAERLHLWSARLPTPTAILGMKTQRLDDVGERLPRALRAGLQKWQGRYDRTAEPLRAAMRSRIAEVRHDLGGTAARLRPTLLAGLAQRDADRVTSWGRLLESLNPLAILSRGYAVVARPDGSLVKSAEDARREVRLGLRFGDSPDPVEVVVGGGGGKPRKSTRENDAPLQAKLL
ncbi:MAG: exodeoxyribonuclease VII large subunit [Sphingosinicella sp.]|nr:exodeoxyribonuclease VII large subunit [Sphingosinicella sp.]